MGLQTFSDDNQEHLDSTGAYFSSASFKLLPQLFKEMVGFSFLGVFFVGFFRDLLLEINFSKRLFVKLDELKERSRDIQSTEDLGKFSSR